MNKFPLLCNILIIGTFLTLSGCLSKKTNSRKTTSDSSTSPINNPGPGDNSGDSGGDGNSGGGNTGGGGTSSGSCSWGTGTEDGVADAGQNINYYKINHPPIITHGTANPNRYSNHHPNGVVWSSATDLDSSFPQSAFLTDSRFNLRVIARPGKQFEDDSKGIYCQYVKNPYTKLNIGVVVRKQGATTGDYYQFKSVPVDCASKVHEFAVPPNTSDPLVVEVRDIEWDYTCTYYKDSSGMTVDEYCPMAPVWDTSCVSLEVQFATDSTKDIPGYRTSN